MRWILKKLAWVAWLPVMVIVGIAYYDPFHLQESAVRAPIPASVDEAVFEVCEKTKQALPNPAIAMRPTIVLPFAGDRESVVVNALKDSLSREGRYRSVDAGVLEQIREQIGLERDAVTDVQQAIKLARAAEAEVVIFGNVRRLTIVGQRADIELELTAIEVESAEPLFRGVITNQTETATQGVVGQSAWHYLLLMSFVLLWPVALTPLSRLILKAESNALTAMGLIVMIAVPIVGYGILLFSSFNGTLAVVVFLVGIVIVGVWCISFTNFVVDHP